MLLLNRVCGPTGYGYVALWGMWSILCYCSIGYVDLQGMGMCVLWY